jgi:PPOX class probable F420-dependent enzyme
MPKAPLPPELERFVAAPRAAVVGTVDPDGSPVTTAVWYGWDDGRIVLSMDSTGPRQRNLRANPHVSLTILGDSWYHHVSLLGRVAEFREDPDLVVLDALSVRYLGAPYDDREVSPVTAVVEIERWHTWGDPGSQQ